MEVELDTLLSESAAGRLQPVRELASAVGRSLALDAAIDRTEIGRAHV